MRNLAAYIPGPVNVILPLALLLLKAAFKVAIDQQVSGTIIVRSLIAAPVDIIFLSLSFLCAFILSPVGTTTAIQLGSLVSVLIVLVLMCLLTVIFSRRSDRNFDGSRFWFTLALSILAYSTSVPWLVFSINLLQ